MECTWLASLRDGAIGALVAGLLGRLMKASPWPRPRIDRVWVWKSDHSHWLKAELRLPKWFALGNARAGCQVSVTYGDGVTVPLMIASEPGPLPEVTLLPGDRYEVCVALWLGRDDDVHMSRELSFKQKAHECRWLSRSRCYNLCDPYPHMPNGHHAFRLDVMQQRQRIASRMFEVTADPVRGFSKLRIHS